MNRLETGIKDGFEEMEHEFPLFRCSVAPGNFPLDRPKLRCIPFTFQPDFPETFFTKQQPTVPANRLKNLAVMMFFFFTRKCMAVITR